MTFWSDPFTAVQQWFQNLLASIGFGPIGVQIVGMLVGVFILAVAPMLFTIFLIWVERKVISRIQDRIGPNRVGPYGLFQPFADMVKIFIKEHITPRGADWLPYNLAPVLAVAAVLMVWAVIPFTVTFFGVDLNVGILYLIAVGSLGEMGIILAGWGSNNKYALLAMFRSVAQLISYEIPLVLSSLVPVMLAGSLNLNDIVKAQEPWFIVTAPGTAIIFFIVSVAEIGRAPFDLAEAESEIVSGFNIEYSGLKFGMFYVAEFLHTFTVALIFTTLFLGGWRGPGAEQYPILGFIYYFIKVGVVYFLLMLIDGTLPRLRIDQMMNLNWKILTPVALAILVVFPLVERLTLNWAVLPRVLVMAGSNLLVLLIGERIASRIAPRTVPEVGSRDRPVARPENVLSQPDTGARG
jgi:NADH-quinone oxidoreductase subunit H